MKPCPQVATPHRPRAPRLLSSSPRSAPPRHRWWPFALAPVARRAFFQDWAQWFESFAARAQLSEEQVEPIFHKRKGRFKGQEASISSRVWQGSGCIRRARAVLVDAGDTVQAFNVVVYPSYRQGLRPVLGVDVLSFRRL